MPQYQVIPYNRAAAIAYANEYAFLRNPNYYNFDYIGGDCTNFASQCIYAGCHIMNYTPVTGWYYINLNNRAPAWTGVEYLYNFLTRNKGVGPFGREVPVQEIAAGDICQLSFDGKVFSHTPFITFAAETKALDRILIAAHTNDSKDRPLSTYNFKKIRFIHIEGARK